MNWILEIAIGSICGIMLSLGIYLTLDHNHIVLRIEKYYKGKTSPTKTSTEDEE